MLSPVSTNARTDIRHFGRRIICIRCMLSCTGWRLGFRDTTLVLQYTPLVMLYLVKMHHYWLIIDTVRYSKLTVHDSEIIGWFCSVFLTMCQNFNTTRVQFVNSLVAQFYWMHFVTLCNYQKTNNYKWCISNYSAPASSNRCCSAVKPTIQNYLSLINTLFAHHQTFIYEYMIHAEHLQ